MKTIKILFACLFAVSIGMTVTAFNKAPEKAAPVAVVFNNWYEYTGDVNDIDEILKPSNYVYRAAAPGCETGSKLCSVFAAGPAGTGQHPTAFSNTLESELEAAFEGDNESDNILMRD